MRELWINLPNSREDRRYSEGELSEGRKKAGAIMPDEESKDEVEEKVAG